MISEGLLDADELTRRATIVRCGFGASGCPFEQDRILCGVAAAGHEVGRRRGVERVSVRIEPAETWRARLIELGMEGEALQPELEVRRFEAQFPVSGAEIQVRSHSPAVVADRVQQPVHIVDEQATGPGLIDQEHHACRLPLNIRKGGELHKVDRDDAVGVGDVQRKRIVTGLGTRGGDQQ